MKIYYSVQNGGDGSAYPMFLTTNKLAEWDQDNMDEGWAERCTGSLQVTSLSQIICPDAMDAVSYWLHRTEDEDWEPWDLRDEFLGAFFIAGLPHFEVRIREDAPYYDIYVDGVKKGERFGFNHDKDVSEATEAGRVKLEERLNAIPSS